MTDNTNGAIDNDFSDSEQTYDERVADALADVRTDPIPGSVAFDLVTRQPLFVRDKVAETCREYYDAEGFDLVTYKMHPWLPGIGPDNAVYECVFLSESLQKVHKSGRTYDYPEGRLVPMPVEMAWTDDEVGEL